MTSLRDKMADYGFESNESYDYAIRCLQAESNNTIPCLNIEGNGGRRKTAFANALANALEVEHIIYHDFTQEDDTKQAPHVVVVDEDGSSKEEPPVELFDRIMSDACALSEAEKTILILDQLNAADFKDHIRLYKFLINHEWIYRDASFFANKQNLTLFIMSEEVVYHSLQKNSFKVWVSATSNRDTPYQTADFKLGSDAEQLINALNEVFDKLKILPTFSEYKKIINDIHHNIRTADHLLTSIYGWTENVDRNLLYSKETYQLCSRIMPIIEDYIGIEESVELTAAHIPNEE